MRLKLIYFSAAVCLLLLFLLPALASSNFQSYTVKVLVNDLTVRKGPGIDTDYAGAIKDKGVYTITDEADGPGASKWGKLKSGAGWINLDYTQKHTISSAFQPYTVKVTAGSLTIRKGPGTNTANAGTIKDKGIYTIVDEADGPGAAKWGKLKSGAGWVKL